METMIAVIPARGGSKGLKDKNIYPVAGKPLIAWSILQARQSACVSDVFVSTDSPEIGAVAHAYGAVVIDRPSAISGDTATSEDALLHAFDVIDECHGVSARHALFLQATSPLRLSHDIDSAIELFFREQADSLMSVTAAADLTLWERQGDLWRSVNFDHRNRMRRQDRPVQYIENGSIYIVARDVLRRSANRIGERLSAYRMEFWQTWEIDTIEEVGLVEYFMRTKMNV
ncbi:MAG TPA: acylneuraminate cytidylyltransferase family protein [Prosthecochloris aestuarii]|uniref:Acylneuraminate cytidylyltransferase family protein n=1 Tax=Prosthecochloris aestuarii TaxID=1102 RepID=A0A831SVM8_PROAE|nr:acylneuraminate cytidylyltransferase family protein [Prosthecochloris aestuarii]